MVSAGGIRGEARVELYLAIGASGMGSVGNGIRVGSRMRDR